MTRGDIQYGRCVWQLADVPSLQYYGCEREIHLHRQQGNLLHAVLLPCCTCNVALDLCCKCKVAYKINVGLRQKTYDGHLLEKAFRLLLADLSLVLCSNC